MPICEVCKKEIDPTLGYIEVGDIDEITGEPKGEVLYFHTQCYMEHKKLTIVEKRE